jgi:hypothetical protein
MAIQDDIVQSMIAVGILDTVGRVLELAKNQRQQESDAAAVLFTTSILGLTRNLCANDDIKTTLCSGDSLVFILEAMRSYPKEALLQEHGCGTLGAMCLRKPSNAMRIIDQGGPNLILVAMKQHPKNLALQRQGALALRNMVSRLNDDDSMQGAKEGILELGAEEVLRRAGQNQACVDEAYAALRDLGCSVGRATIHADGSISTRPVMFGEVQSNFRPVYDE